MRHAIATMGLVVLFFAQGPGPARALTCIAPECRFLVPPTTEVTSDIGGIPVWNTGCYGRNQTPTVPLADHFIAERQIIAGWTEIPFRVVLVDSDCRPASLTCGPIGKLGWVLLLVPEGGFRAGDTYRFTIRALPEKLSTATTIVVAKAHPPHLPTTTTLDVGVEATGPLAVAVDSLNCAATSHGFPKVRVSRRSIEMVLPQAWQRFRRSLLYGVTIDGSPWQPGCAPCDSPGPGRSWVGPGREVLFADCPLPDTSSVVEVTPGYAPRALSPGAHEVQMVAWLPGTSMTVTARAEVVLTCASELWR